MCDYSNNIPSRLAETGDELITYKLLTNTIVLVCPKNLSEVRNYPEKYFLTRLFSKLFKFKEPVLKAVCVAPGATIFLSDIPQTMQKEMNLPSEAVVIFSQENMEKENVHHDAVIFPNKTIVSLQHFKPGTTFQILNTEPEQTISTKKPNYVTV